MTTEFNREDFKKVYIPLHDSHKGQNGKVLIIGGSQLFHAASLWPLKIASRLVDMVFYSSVQQNNDLVTKMKQEFQDGIVVPREKIEDYIEEAECVVIGPGLPRAEGQLEGDDDTQRLTEELLTKYPYKKWVIDGGSLQTISPDYIPKRAIITPHHREFVTMFQMPGTAKTVSEVAQKYNCIVLLKGPVDMVAYGNEVVEIKGGNAGMTKGGTGDVLAGLVGALNCKNDPFLAAKIASFINKKAGESLYERVGLYYNASDLVDEIPKILKEYMV